MQNKSPASMNGLKHYAIHIYKGSDILKVALSCSKSNRSPVLLFRDHDLHFLFQMFNICEIRSFSCVARKLKL